MAGTRWALMLGLALIGAPALAHADEYSLANPTPADKLRALCTDRPTKSTSPCTVDPGHFQLESDVFNETVDREGGVTTITQLFTSPTLKLGVTPRVDVELNIAPYEREIVRDHNAGTETRDGGVGDLFLKAKYSLLGDDGGTVGFGLEPYVKVPTARGPIGNGKVEEGLIAPIQVALPAGWSVVFDPEVDVLANSAGDGRHANISSLVSLSKGVTSQVTVSAELWGDVNYDPAGRVTQASADLGAAWVPKAAPNLQFDGGVNLGLNRRTPGVQGYIGVSRRF